MITQVTKKQIFFFNLKTQHSLRYAFSFYLYRQVLYSTRYRQNTKELYDFNQQIVKILIVTKVMRGPLLNRLFFKTKNIYVYINILCIVYTLIFIPKIISLLLHYIVIKFTESVMANFKISVHIISLYYMFCTTSSLKIFHIPLLFHDVDTAIHISYDRRTYLLVYSVHCTHM